MNKFTLIFTSVGLLALTGCTSVSTQPSTSEKQADPAYAVPAILPTNFNPYSVQKVEPTPGPTDLIPTNTRIIYERYARIMVGEQLQTYYQEYFMERPTTITYQGEKVPAALMTRRINDGKSVNEVKILFAINKGKCLSSEGQIIELDPNTQIAKNEAVDWVMATQTPIVRTFYDTIVPAQNVLASEICSDYNFNFLDKKLSQIEAIAKEPKKPAPQAVIRFPKP